MSQLLAALLAGSIVTWAVVNFTIEGAGSAVLVPQEVRIAEEVASALLAFFGALVLALYPAEGSERRVYWISAGLVFLGFEHLAFGYLEPLLSGEPMGLDEALYASLFVRTFGAGFIVIGLIPRTPPRLSGPRLAAILLLPFVLYAFALEPLLEGSLPPDPATIPSLTAAVESGSGPLEWLSPWHWALSALPFGLAAAALAGACNRSRRGKLGEWLLFATVLFAGSQLHSLLWPTAYGSPILTTADFLRLAFVAVVAVGAVIELRRVAVERGRLLGVERESVRRLSELEAMRAEFISMVAHELGNPLTAVRRLVGAFRSMQLDDRTRASLLSTIEIELDALDALILDVQVASAIERDDFRVETGPVLLSELMVGAEAYGVILPGGHPVEVVLDESLLPGERVRADPKRIGQVLRNLLSNAARYSPEGSPIELRAARDGSPANERIRIEVADHGPGVHPEDVSRIFERFERNRDPDGKTVSGAGLGLYVSRSIVRAHGSELTVASAPSKGSVFGFELETAR